MMTRTTISRICLATCVAATGVLASCESSNRSRAADRTAQDDFDNVGEPAQPAALTGEDDGMAAGDRDRQRTRPVRRDRGNAYYPQAGANQIVSEAAFPTGELATSVLLLHTVIPAQVRVGEEFAYEYHVTNLTSGALSNVGVILDSSSNLEILGSSPSATNEAGDTVWAIGDLAGGETEVIRVDARAERAGQFVNCVSVRYANALCAVGEVVDPQLDIVKSATQRTLRCDPFQLTYTVCNNGTGVATNVRISDRLPTGITTTDGSSTVSVDVGDLAAGECRDVTVTVEASRTGEFGSVARAMGAGGLEDESGEPMTVVIAPELEIECTSRSRQFLNRNAEWEFVVTNNGDGPARDAQVTINFPANAQFVRASGNGQATGGGVTWNLGTLESGRSQTVSVVLTATRVSTVTVNATANSFCAEPVSTSCTTEFRGIPAILLEVVDVTDPVEIGTETTYVIRVTNQGSADDENVTIVAQLPDQQSYIGATGPTRANVRGQTIAFAPFASLSPQEVIEYQITVRADEEGDVRFAIELTSDNLTSPVRETEATNLYSSE